LPIYEYRCRDCGRVTEILARPDTSPAELRCRHCQGRNLDKMISLPAAVRTGTSSPKGKTCCGRDERCDRPPCSTGDACRRDK